MTTIIQSARQTGKTTAMVKEIVRVCPNTTIYVHAANTKLARHVIKLVRHELFSKVDHSILYCDDSNLEHIHCYMPGGKEINIYAKGPQPPYSYTGMLPGVLVFYDELIQLRDLPLDKFHMITSTYVSAEAIANKLQLQEYTVKRLPEIPKLVPASTETVKARLKLLGLAAEKIEEILYNKVRGMYSEAPSYQGTCVKFGQSTRCY